MRYFFIAAGAWTFLALTIDAHPQWTGFRSIITLGAVAAVWLGITTVIDLIKEYKS